MSDSIEGVRELLLTSASRWRTLTAEGSEWRHHDRLQEAWARGIGDRALALSSRTDSIQSVEPPEEHTESWRLWLAPGNRRAQFPVGGEFVDVVFQGTTWWSVSRDAARTNAGRENYGHGAGWGAALIETEGYVPFLELREVSRSAFLGRDVYVVRALPLWHRHNIHEARLSLHALVIGAADDVVLTIDVERGVILRSESRLDGVPYRILEIGAISFDDETLPNTFTITPLEGQAWQVVSDRSQLSRISAIITHPLER